MKLTKTQKNFRKQMKNYKSDDTLSYINKKKTVTFREYKEPYKKKNNFWKIIKIMFWIYIIIKFIRYILHI